VKHLQDNTGQDKTSVVLFLYCKHSTTYTVEGLFESLLGQLLLRLPAVSAGCVDFLRRQRRSKEDLLLADVKSLLSQEIQGMSRVFIAADGFDEIRSEEVQHGTLMHLHQLMKSCPSLRLLISSRPFPLIQRMMGASIKIDIVAKPEDIKLYIESRIEHSTFLHDLAKQYPALKGEIVETVTDRAAEMYVISSSSPL
jgi:hypothetical protein